MSEENHQRGPIMLCATSVLKPGPTRIGRIGNHITLPRTVALPQLVAGIGGGLLGGILGMLVLGGVQPVLMSAAFMGLLGVVLVTYQPMRGESLLRWIGLEVMSRRNRIEIDGQVAQAYIGICPVTYVESGKIRIVPGAVDVPEGSVDDRGVFVDDAFTDRGGLLTSLGAKKRSSRDVFAAHRPVEVELPAERAPQWAIRRGVALPEHAPEAWAESAQQHQQTRHAHAPGVQTASGPQVPWVAAQPGATETDDLRRPGPPPQHAPGGPAPRLGTRAQGQAR